MAENIPRRFQDTPDGAKQAKAYLESIGELERFMASAFSTDGWSLIATANYEHEKRSAR